MGEHVHTKPRIKPPREKRVVGPTEEEEDLQEEKRKGKPSKEKLFSLGGPAMDGEKMFRMKGDAMKEAGIWDTGFDNFETGDYIVPHTFGPATGDNIQDVGRVERVWPKARSLYVRFPNGIERFMTFGEAHKVNQNALFWLTSKDDNNPEIKHAIVKRAIAVLRSDNKNV